MRKYNPYRNIFYYYRGPSNKKDEYVDAQIENNATKALINTLENSEKGLLQYFLSSVDIDTGEINNVSYDLQISGKGHSIPDAGIQIDQNTILIESKIGSKFIESQALEHLKSLSKGYLLYITPLDEDRDSINRMGKKNLRFITWKSLYSVFNDYGKKASGEKTKFVLKEFVEYLEAIGMAPFNGWNNKDFEAFLNVEEDPKKELRLRVKEKLKQYLFELDRSLKNEGTFKDLEFKVGLSEKENNYIWGILCKPDIKDSVYKPHFNFVINSDEFMIGIQIESIEPATKMKKNIDAHRQTFLDILRKLDGFDLVIRKRIDLHRPSKWEGKRAVTIKLREEYLTMADVEYIIKKAEHLGKIELHCGKHFKRDDRILDNAAFLEHSIEIMRKLKDYYNFSLGDNL